ncbi:MAG: hypothetical protein RIT45_1960 [Pseudomonadota bacterium]
MKLLWPEQMRALDARTISELGLSGATLMETAGRGVADFIAGRVGAAGADRLVTVVCGVGNNGGDGFVVARELHDRGYRVHVFVAGVREALSPESTLHLLALERLGVRPRLHDGPPGGGELKNLHRSLLRSAVIVDALLGIGPRAAGGPLREPMRTWVAQLDGRHDAFKVAIDVPSGLCAETGRALGVAATVDAVVCMAAAKPGLWLGDGPAHHREVHVVDIGVPRRWIADAAPGAWLLDAAIAGAALPPRPEHAHKGTFGHLLVVAGSPGRSGAALLAAQAALRGGVGLCTLATSGEVRARLEGQVPDLMVEAIRGGSAEAARVLKLLEGKRAVAVGPGLGTGSAEIDLVGRLCDGTEGPVVLDADALRIVAGKPEAAASAAGRLVLTPHPGEMAALLGIETTEVEADRATAARTAAERFGAVVVLKGARTLIARPDGALVINGTPEPALAVAGSGDVLCGLVGALLAQGCEPWQAAIGAVAAHLHAGAEVARRFGRRASMASDLIGALPEAWQALEREAGCAGEGTTSRTQA